MTVVSVLAGGLCPERDVSLRSGRRMAEALRERGLEVQVVDTDAALLPQWELDPPDVVLPMLHGAVGEDGSLRDVLETLGLPFVGAVPTACRLAFDKPIAKAAVAKVGVATADWIALPHSAFRELGANRIMKAAINRLGLPLVVKPTRGGSALGLSIVHTAEELPPAMVAAFAYSDTVMLEQFVPGTEIAVSVIERNGVAEVLPAVEIHSDSGIYDYQARYTAGMSEFFVPARLSEAAADAAANAALTAHKVLGLRDFSRTDLIVSPSGTAFFLETNVAPGMTETSLLPQSVVAAGYALGEVFEHLIQQAHSR